MKVAKCDCDLWSDFQKSKLLSITIKVFYSHNLGNIIENNSIKCL